MPSLKSIGALTTFAGLSCAPSPVAPPAPASAVPVRPVAPPPRTSGEASPAPPPVSRTAVRIALGGGRGCARLKEGGVDCWGGARSSAPAPVPSAKDASDAVLSPSGDLWVVRPDGKVASVEASGKERELQNVRDVAAVAASYPGTCTLGVDGKVACYRAGTWDEQHQREPAPDRVASLTGGRRIDLGPHFGCVVHETGRVSCFQHSIAAPQALRAVSVPEVTDAVDVRVGVSMACALRKDRRTFCFSLGQRTRKTAELGSADAIDVAQDDGDSAPLVCLADGVRARCQRAEAFGSGWTLPTVSTEVVTFSGSAPLRELAVTGSAVCALDATGSVACFGHNIHGVLGRPDARFADEPVKVKGMTRARTVATGIGFSCALSVAGEVHCWGKAPHGRGQSGQLPPDPTVKKVDGLPTVSRLIASKGYACAFGKGGEAHCFFGMESELSPTRKAYRVPVLDSARELILPEMGFTNYAAVIDKDGALLLGPSNAFDSIEKIVLSKVSGFEHVRRIASSYWRLYVQDDAGAVSRLDVSQGQIAGKPVRLPELDGASSLGGQSHALMASGAVLREADGKVEKLREASDWTSLLGGDGPCGVTRLGEMTCLESGPGKPRVLARGIQKISRSMFHRTHTCFVDARGDVACLEDCSYGQCGGSAGLFGSETPVSVFLP